MRVLRWIGSVVAIPTLSIGCVDRVIEVDGGELGADDGTMDGGESGDDGSTPGDPGPGPDCVPPGPACPCPDGTGPQGDQCVPPPEQLVPLSPLSQTALAGSYVPAPPAVVLVTGDGTPLPNVDVSFAVSGVGSAIDAVSVTTDASGVASVGGWQLGQLAGSYGVTASVPSLPATAPVAFEGVTEGDFDITLDFIAPVTPEQEAAFDFAARRWEGIILNAQPVVNANALDLANLCGQSTEPQDLAISGVHIFVQLAPIDGPGMGGVNILGSAGPCALREIGSPFTGAMTFDTFDLDELAAAGKLETVILHEMGHVLGIGTLWPALGLVANPSVPDSAGVDTHFVGDNARAAFQDMLGPILLPGEPVPVENNAQPGSADGHWRENVLDVELMTPALGDLFVATPLSILTIASLMDHGYYDANMFAADPYVLFSQQGGEEAAGPQMIDELLYPRAIMDRDGTLIPLPVD